MDLARRVAEAADLVTVALDELLPRADGPESRLTEAMRYAALGPGKRLRTFSPLRPAGCSMWTSVTFCVRLVLWNACMPTA